MVVRRPGKKTYGVGSRHRREKDQRGPTCNERRREREERTDLLCTSCREGAEKGEVLCLWGPYREGDAKGIIVQVVGRLSRKVGSTTEGEGRPFLHKGGGGASRPLFGVVPISRGSFSGGGFSIKGEGETKALRGEKKKIKEGFLQIWETFLSLAGEGSFSSPRPCVV